jgi:multiple sugar transport system permease protein
MATTTEVTPRGETGENRPSPRGGGAVRRGLREGPAAWMLALPFCVLFLVFTAWPVVQSLFMSLTDTKSRDLRSPFAVNIVGFDNFTKAFSDPVFRKAALNTAYFVVIGMPLTLGIALAAAVALDRGITRFRSAFRLGFYLPVITSIVAVAVVWRFLLQDEFGLINTVLGWVGIPGPNWLGDPNWSMPGLILMAAWRNFGTAMIIFLAGLQGVPWVLHEAASIDGAGAWQRFRHITLPMLRPTLLFVSVTTSIGYLQFFEEPFVMTNGGPLNSTISMSMYTYKQFGFGNYALASAMSYLIFVVIAVVTAIQFRLLRERT